MATQCMALECAPKGIRVNSGIIQAVFLFIVQMITVLSTSAQQLIRDEFCVAGARSWVNESWRTTK